MSPTAQSIISFLSGLSGPTAYIAIFGLLMACGVGIPIPEDVTLIGSGILAAVGSVSLLGAMAVCFTGVMIGDAFMFNLGRVYGRRAFKLPIIRRIMTPKRIALAERKVLRNSKFICFTARFLPGLRSPIFLTSGILGVRPHIFMTLDGFAALISVPVWVFGGYIFGQNIDLAFKYAARVQVGLFLSVAGFILAYIWFRRCRKLRRAQRLIHHMSK